MTRARGARHGHRRRARRHVRPADEAAVSDVIGSILLVGITVVMAAGFGALLLAYDGPDDKQHTQLNVAITQAAAGWPNALIVITNLGGEPLRQQDVTIRYQQAGGPLRQVTPTNFTDGQLLVGQTWKYLINAVPGDVVPITVVVTPSRTSQVVASVTVPAGGAVAVVLSYTDGVATTRGSVGNFANAGTIADDVALFSEASVGSPQSTSTYVGGSPTAATVQASDTSRASVSALGSSVQAENFNIGSPFSVDNVQIGFEGRGIYPTVTRQQAAQGSGNGAFTVSTTTQLTLAPNDVVVVVVAQGNNAGSIRNVALSPISGMAWTTLTSETASAGTGRLDTFVGVYTGAGTSSVVTATFTNTLTPFGAALFDRAAIAAARYSNVDTAAPVQAVLDNQASGNGQSAFATSGVAGTANPSGSVAGGRFVAAINAVASAGVTWTGTSPTTPVAFVTQDVSNRVELSVADVAAADANNIGSGSVGSNQDWQAVGLTLKPQPLPTVQLTYHLTPAGAAGSTPTPLSPTLSTTEATVTQDITSAKAWSSADFGATGLAVRLTVTGETGGAVEINRIFVTITSTSGPATYQMDITIDWPAPSTVPTSGTHLLQLRYQTNGIDTFNVLVGGTRNCGVLGSPSQLTTLSCLLTQAEANALTVRFTDVGSSGTSQGTFSLAYAVVRST